MFSNELHPEHQESMAKPQSEPDHSCSECSNTIGELKNELSMALTTIKMLRTEVDLLKQSQIGPPGMPVNSEQSVIVKICERLEAIERDQKEMKTTCGAQISSAIRKGQMSNNAQPTCSDPMQHQGVTGQSSQ